MKSDATQHHTLSTGANQDVKSFPGTVSAELLFRGAKEIVIRHHGDDYRLRITRNDKLILTK